jgi:tetratricopeptide (TPR) repeat protein
MKRGILVALAAALLAGCATELEQGNRMFAAGQYTQARQCYEKALARERARAQLPVWSGNQFRYRFKASDAAQAIVGIGNTYRAERNSARALYYYFYFTQFCLRHELDFGSQIHEVEIYIQELASGTESANTNGWQQAPTDSSGPGKEPVTQHE